MGRGSLGQSSQCGESRLAIASEYAATSRDPRFPVIAACVGDQALGRRARRGESVDHGIGEGVGITAGEGTPEQPPVAGNAARRGRQAGRRQPPAYRPPTPRATIPKLPAPSMRGDEQVRTATQCGLRAVTGRTTWRSRSAGGRSPGPAMTMSDPEWRQKGGCGLQQYVEALARFGDPAEEDQPGRVAAGLGQGARTSARQSSRFRSGRRRRSAECGHGPRARPWRRLRGGHRFAAAAVAACAQPGPASVISAWPDETWRGGTRARTRAQKAADGVIGSWRWSTSVRVSVSQDRTRRATRGPAEIRAIEPFQGIAQVWPVLVRWSGVSPWLSSVSTGTLPGARMRGS